MSGVGYFESQGSGAAVWLGSRRGSPTLYSLLPTAFSKPTAHFSQPQKKASPFVRGGCIRRGAAAMFATRPHGGGERKQF